jgi:peptide/nickel transport system ATP-binding protein
MLERVGLSGRLAKAYPRQLSGGQRQRVAIARALILRPKVVICDEPTSALDVSVQAQILSLLFELQDDFKLSYIFISHNLAVIEDLSDRIAVMHQGRFVETGPAAEVLANPKADYTKRLLGSSLKLDARLNDGLATPADSTAA